MEREQGGQLRKDPRPPRQPGLDLPDWLEDEIAETRQRQAIVPPESNALTLRLSTLRPGPDLAAALAAAREPEPQGDGDFLTPSGAERQLRHQLSEQVAAQAVEDAAEGVSGAVAPPRGASPHGSAALSPRGGRSGSGGCRQTACQGFRPCWPSPRRAQ